MLTRLARLLGFEPRPAPALPAPAPPAAIDAPLAAAAAALREGRADDAVARLEAIVREHPDAAEAHLMLGTVLHERRRFEDARDCYVLAAHYRPAWWAPAFHLGMIALDTGRVAEALAALTQAVELGGNTARVLNALGTAQLGAGELASAVDSFRRAIALDETFALAHSNLGYVLFAELEQYDEGTRHIERALALAPEDPTVQCNGLLVLQHTQRTAEALALADALLERDPGLAEARLNRALMLLARRDFARGWPDYEARKSLPGSGIANDVAAPEWDGSPLAGRSIYVYSEQGLGDQIMFASCIPDLLALGARCTLECQPKLEKLFRRAFPPADVIARPDAGSLPPRAAPAVDFKVAIGSLPRFFRRRASDFPRRAHGYLCADPARVAHWKDRLARLPGRLKIGISWRGGVATTRRSLRSIPLERWAPVLSLPGVDFVSLQYADPDGERSRLQRSSPLRVDEWREAIDDYDETAALVCALDLVVSVQTAVVHLAGALARPVWVLMPAAAEWRYGADGDSMLWYPTAKLVRQRPGEAWDEVIRRTAAGLQIWAADVT